jgi:Recombinase
VAILVQLLAAFGSAAGRGPHFRHESTPHYPCLNVVLVGQSSKARKGTSWQHVKSLLGAADPEWAKRRIIGGLSSGEGLINAVRDERNEKRPRREGSKIVGYEDVLADAGETDKRLLVIESEFARVLQAASRDGSTLSAVIREAWDSGHLNVMTKSPVIATDARRGTGSWDPSAIREMLRRERYAGVYVHGVKDRVKRGGKRVAVPADPSQVLRVPMPAWRIVDSVTWDAVQAALAQRNSYTRTIGPHAKHPMAGLAICSTCGGSIGARNIRTTFGQTRGYGCSFHARRGPYVCPVALTQPVEEVEGALVDHMRSVVLTEDRVDRIVECVRRAIVIT